VSAEKCSHTWYVNYSAVSTGSLFKVFFTVLSQLLRLTNQYALLLLVLLFTPSPVGVAEYCDEHACMLVCGSVGLCVR